MKDASKRLRKEAGAVSDAMGEMIQGDIFRLPFDDATASTA